MNCPKFRCRIECRCPVNPPAPGGAEPPTEELGVAHVRKVCANPGALAGAEPALFPADPPTEALGAEYPPQIATERAGGGAGETREPPEWQQVEDEPPTEELAVDADPWALNTLAPSQYSGWPCNASGAAIGRGGWCRVCALNPAHARLPFGAPEFMPSGMPTARIPWGSGQAQPCRPAALAVGG